MNLYEKFDTYLKRDWEVLDSNPVLCPWEDEYIILVKIPNKPEEIAYSTYRFDNESNVIHSGNLNMNKSMAIENFHYRSHY